MRRLEASDTATILAALRLFQRTYEGSDGAAIEEAWPEHFIDEAIEPLSTEDIDSLCEEINFGEVDFRPEADTKEIEKLLRRLKKTFDGDSNDAEHDAAVELVDYLEEHVIPPKVRPQAA